MKNTTGIPQEHKTFNSYLLKADDQQGIVESIVAVMGNVDQGDDIIHPGAFTKTMTEQLGKIKVLDQHNTDSILRVLGRPVAMRELNREQLPADLLAKYPSATGGLYTKTQYNLQTDNGRNAFNLISAGDVSEYSIGYDPVGVDYSHTTVEGKDRTVRNLRQLRLYEYSPVIWAMNSATATLSAKGATGAAGLPFADRAHAWDSTGAEGRVRTWADATDAPNAKYRDAFFWVDSSAPDNFTSYKLQFADVIDGKLTAIPRGIFAVAAVLQGSRGGVDIPAGDKDAIKSKVNAYYSRMRKEFDDESITAPWEAKAYKDMKPWNVFYEGDKWNVYKLDADGKPTGEALGSHDNEADARAQVRALYASENNKAAKSVDLTSYVQEVTEAFNEQYGMNSSMNYGPMSECYCIWRVFDDHVIVCEMMSDDYYQVDYTSINGEIVFAPKPQWIEGDLAFAPETMNGGEMKRYAPQADRQIKAGRVLAARNAERIMSAARSLMAALADAGIDMSASDSTDNTDNIDQAPAKRAASATATTSTGPTVNTSPIDQALLQSIEIELATLQLLEV